MSSKRITEIILRVAVIPGLRIIRAFSENCQVIRIGYGRTSGMNKSDYTNKLAIIRGFGIVNKGQAGDILEISHLGLSIVL